MKIYRRSFLRNLLLILLSLKVSYFIYENTSFFENSDAISIVVDMEESENKEADENEKINQPLNSDLLHFQKNFKYHNPISKNYVNWHSGCKPHPPEFS